MRTHMRCSLVAASLAGALALGIMGCSGADTSATSSDADTAADSATSDVIADTPTSSEDDSANPAASDPYVNDEFGIRYELPEGFEFTETHDTLDFSEGPALAFDAENEANDIIYLYVTPLTEELQASVNDELIEQYAEYDAVTFANDLENDGCTIISKVIGTHTLSSGEELPVTIIQYEENGATTFVSSVFVVRNEALLQVTAWASEESSLDTMVDGLTFS